MAPVLSILILSIPSRSESLARLLNSLAQQITSSVEVIIALDAAATIGSKRNQLLDAAKGEYVCFIDDDDFISPCYVSRIIAALETKPDCVTFRASRRHDGKRVGFIEYALRHDDFGALPVGGEMVYTKPVSHLCPVRSNLARTIRFPELNDGEDYDYIMRLRPLLTTEVHIPDELYHYEYVSRAVQ